MSLGPIVTLSLFWDSDLEFSENLEFAQIFDFKTFLKIIFVLSPIDADRRVTSIPHLAEGGENNWGVGWTSEKNVPHGFLCRVILK